MPLGEVAYLTGKPSHSGLGIHWGKSLSSRLWGLGKQPVINDICVGTCNNTDDITNCKIIVLYDMVTRVSSVRYDVFAASLKALTHAKVQASLAPVRSKSRLLLLFL